jgi:hypothetical protein
MAFIVIAGYQRPGHLPWPSVLTIAEQCACSERHATRLIADLEAVRALVRIPRWTDPEDGNEPERTSNAYVLVDKKSTSGFTEDEMAGVVTSMSGGSDIHVTRGSDIHVTRGSDIEVTRVVTCTSPGVVTCMSGEVEDKVFEVPDAEIADESQSQKPLQHSEKSEARNVADVEFHGYDGFSYDDPKANAAANALVDELSMHFTFDDPSHAEQQVRYVVEAVTNHSGVDAGVAFAIAAITDRMERRGEEVFMEKAKPLTGIKDVVKIVQAVCDDYVRGNGWLGRDVPGLGALDLSDPSNWNEWIGNHCERNDTDIFIRELQEAST